MDTHRITGAVKEIAGSAQEAAGSIVGDGKTRRDGRARKAEGQIERNYGEWLDTTREVIRERPLLALAGVGFVVFALGAVRRSVRS